MLREVLGDAFRGAGEGNHFNDLEWEEKVGRSSRTLCSWSYLSKECQKSATLIYFYIWGKFFSYVLDSEFTKHTLYAR